MSKTKDNSKDKHKNRGMKLENKIQNRCDYIKDIGAGLINKVPTEIKMVRGSGGRIISAFPVKESSFVDFCGIFNGKAISIEAKSTNNKTSFPFSNIHDYQITFLDDWILLGGIGYYIICFDVNKKIFIVKSNYMNKLIKSIGRKSLPYTMCLENENFIELDYEFCDFEKYIS